MQVPDRQPSNRRTDVQQAAARYHKKPRSKRRPNSSSRLGRQLLARLFGNERTGG